MSAFTSDQVRWFAENAERQRSGPVSVWWMANAFEWFCDNDLWDSPPTIETVLGIGSLVDPFVNLEGFRRTNVRVGMHVAPDWMEVPRLMGQLVAAGCHLSPDEWYREFEEIHPFRDGNGRTGALLWNGARWRHAGARGELVHPPDFFNAEWFE